MMLFIFNMTVCVSCSGVFGSLQPHELSSTRFLCPCDLPGKNTGMGFHALLQGIFLTQGLNPGLPYCRQILYHLSYQGSLIMNANITNDQSLLLMTMTTIYPVPSVFYSLLCPGSFM